VNKSIIIESNLVHKIDDRTALQLRPGVTKLLQSDEAGIRVAENAMSVSKLERNQLG
jgi:hypothetical protein